jgi:hypothetical protein
MAELEIHHETEGESDPLGKKVGVLAAVLAVALAIVTIASHRTHTAAIMHKSTANDQWTYYQATRIKLHSVEMGEELAEMLGGDNGKAAAVLAKSAEQKKKYDETAVEIQKEAKKADSEAEEDEHRALKYDIGEGLLEIGLVLSSLYFISKKKMFPVMGITAGIVGTVIAIMGMMS